MVFSIYGADGRALGLVERYAKASWTRRLYEPGEFEIEAPATPEHLAILRDGNLVVRDASDGDAGIIEGVELERDEEGAVITATGRLLASVLERRVILQEEALKGAAESVMLKLIHDNCIEVDEERKIPGLSVPVSQERGGEITQDRVHGKNLLDVLEDIAQAQTLGFRVCWPSWEVEIVEGLDRSAGQSVHPRAILSVEGETLSTVSYTHDSAGTASVAMVYCDLSNVEGLDSFTETVGEASGLERREMYRTAGAKDAVVTVEIHPPDQGGTVTTTDYSAGARNVGRQALASRAQEDAISGETANLGGLTLRVDFDLGDVVTVESAEWGLAQDARITETTEICDEEGERAEVVFGNRRTIRKLLQRERDE